MNALLKLTNPRPHKTKAPTGILGLDEITGGGLPRGRTTLIEGGAGAGKTVLGLEFLVNGARRFHEPGIFVAFEERADRLIANAAQFGWNLPELQRKSLFFLDAQPTPDLIKSGKFDFGGMLAGLGAKVRQMRAKRIVFDAVDIVLALLGTQSDVEWEIFKLHDWLMANELTAIITSKFDRTEFSPAPSQSLGFMQFMVDCSIVLSHLVGQGISRRNLRVIKYRGSSFEENEVPFIIGNLGFEIAAASAWHPSQSAVSNDRVSTGVARLNSMLDGGYFRGAVVLITGSPGTSKTTLAGAFAEAACRRGERTMFVSFDSDSREVIRNLASVNINLDHLVKKGTLRMISVLGTVGNAETHLVRIQKFARDHRTRCLVIDPISSLVQFGSDESSKGLSARLINWAKKEGVTLLSTSLLERASPELEGTPIQISTLADTWIHLSYLVRAGERNRGLSIVKSRGTSHSNQVRELILSGAGVTLTDVYTASGEVLMGTLRREKEQAERAAEIEREAKADRDQNAAEAEEAELVMQIAHLERELKAKRADGLQTKASRSSRRSENRQRQAEMKELRKSDAEISKRK